MSALKDKHPFLQIIAFCGIALASLVIFSFLSLVAIYLIFNINPVTNPGIISEFNDPAAIPVMKLIQLFNAVGLFLVPPLIFMRLTADEALHFNRIKYPPFIFYALTVVLMISALPMINFLAEINERINLPESLSGIESWMKEKEEMSQRLVEAFLKVSTIPALFYNLLLMAIIPGVGEELLFRGVLQRLFNRWFKNHHTAIIFTAVLFSAVHMQFYGFIPRMLLGVLLGYLLVWSGSLLAPMLAHFINNALAVIMYYFINTGKIPKEVEEVGTHEDALYYNLSSFIIVSILLLILYRNRLKPDLYLVK